MKPFKVPSSFGTLFSDPYNLHFVIDRDCHVLWLCRTAENIFSEKEIIPEETRLEELLIPVPPARDNIFKPEYFRQNPSCFTNLYVCPDIAPADPVAMATNRLYFYTYSAVTQIKGRYVILITLSPNYLSLCSPISQALISLNRQIDKPMVLLEKDFTIYWLNVQFMTMLNCFGESQLKRHSIFDFVDEKFLNPNPFIVKSRGDISKKAMDNLNKPEWRFAYEVDFKKGSPPYPGIFVNKGIRQRREGKGVQITKRDTNESPVFAFKNAVNFPNNDMKVSLKMRMETGSDITLAFTHPAAGGVLGGFNHGYHFDILFDGEFKASFYRRSSPLDSFTVGGILPGEEVTVDLYIVGPVINIFFNGIHVFEYIDPSPVTGAYVSHLNMYIWKKSVLFEKAEIFSRPTVFKTRDISDEFKNFVAFKNFPDRVYKIRLEHVFYVSRIMTAVSFIDTTISFGGKKGNNASSKVEQAKNYIADNYFRRIDFEKIARTCCISYIHFNKVFKKRFRLSPKQYQTELKLSQAQKLLRTGQYKIKEIGEMVGIDDESNFQHLFRKRFGVTPGSIRKKNN
ncbi:MAG: helix-turn-helix transcriptional regulator [Fibrobacterota bacterium]